MTKLKRFICLIFLSLLVSDICNYIKFNIENKGVKVKEYSIFFTKYSNDTKMFNLCLIYFLIVVVIYFFINFFKKHNRY